MEIRRCMKCMRELKAGEMVCPECGQAIGEGKTEPFALKPGTILDGKYLVGEMLGQGGFGITYIGFDLLLEQKVAIKEYFPMSPGMVSRDNQASVVWNSTMMEKSGVQKGFDSFLKEARKMAKLGEIPNIVGVKSVFIQNETAYIVMDFIEGETLLKKLEREGPMSFDTCVSLLRPIIQALLEVHKHGIIHRDISPDNIMVQKNGKLILLDLGAAKDLDIQAANGTVQSSQLVAKQGFSPFEQYGRNGKIGPWTDVYAMAATIYYCCTGILPPSAIDRIEEDTLSCQPLLTNAQFDALAACMITLPGKRPQDMDAMLRILDGKLEQKKPEPPRAEPIKPIPTKAEPPKNKPVKSETPLPEPKAEKRRPALLKWLMPIAGIAVLCLLAGIPAKPDTSEEKISAPLETEVATQAQTEPEETILHLNPGAVMEFGRYEQDNNETNGAETIEWLVLDVQGNKALLLSKHTLDAKPYHKNYEQITWEDCSLRNWLNSAFLESAFSDEERNAILITDVDNSSSQGNEKWNIESQNSTLDRVFLLSYAEAECYFVNDNSRVCKPTEYAVSNGAETRTLDDGTPASCWWLRSPGESKFQASFIEFHGTRYANDVGNGYIAVRPAIWIDISNDAFIQELSGTNLVNLQKISDTNSEKSRGRDVVVGATTRHKEIEIDDAIRFWVVKGSGYTNTESIDLYLADSYTTLSGWVFAGDESGDNTNMTLRFYGDGKFLDEITDIEKGKDLYPKIDVTGVNVLKIECTTEKNAQGYCYIQAVVEYNKIG